MGGKGNLLMCFLPSVLFLIVSWSKIWTAVPRQPREQSCIPRVSPFTEPGKALVTQLDTYRFVFFNWSTQKLQKLPKKPAAIRQQSANAWMGDLCIIPSTEKYPHLGRSCPLIVGGTIPTVSQRARISTVVFYQEKPIQRDRYDIS